MTTETLPKKSAQYIMSTTMSSIRSVLIRTCMANIQKEVSQLEHWLNNLSDETPTTIPSQQPVHTYDEQFELSNMNRVIERLAEEMNNQRHTLDNILERIDHLEGFNRPLREVFIGESDKNKNTNDPWLDNNCEPLENEVIGDDDDISEPLYTTQKKHNSPTSSVGTPSIIPDIPEDHSLPPDIDSDDDAESEKESMPPTKVRILETKKPVVEVEVVEDEDEEEEVVIEEKKDEKKEKEVVVEEEEEEEEAEEEEEEEGIEFEEIEYKGVRYYKDGENFIYSVSNEDEPSENPVGYWKEKTQTIAFYKTK